MRFRSWHKWLSKLCFSRGWTLLFPIIVCGFHCRAQNPKPSPEAQNAVIASIAWTFEGSDDFGISEKDFHALADKAILSFEHKSKSPCKLIVVGELRINDELGSLYLDAQTRSEVLKGDISTGIAAQGAASDRAKATTLIGNGLRDLLGAISDMVTLSESTPAKWVKALKDPEPDIQILAIKLLGAHRIRRAIAPIAELLGDPREQVTEAAATALGDIGDPNAVPLLIQSIERGNLRSEVRAIEAMGRIGGKEANAYLEMTAIGHEVPEVRRLSATLLKRSKSL